MNPLDNTLVEDLIAVDETIEKLMDQRAIILQRMSDETRGWAHPVKTDQYIVRQTTKGMDSFLPVEAIEFALDAGLINNAERIELLPPPKPRDPKVSLRVWNRMCKADPRVEDIDKKYRQSHPKPGPIVVERRSGEQIREVGK